MINYQKSNFEEWQIEFPFSCPTCGQLYSTEILDGELNVYQEVKCEECGDTFALTIRTLFDYILQTKKLD
jgi:transcription elongation factor Elf1